jgi:hypothetical protein
MARSLLRIEIELSGRAGHSKLDRDMATTGTPASVALVIGISRYRYLRPLPTMRDAEDVAALLAAPDRGGYDPARVQLLLEEEATRAGIEAALLRLRRDAVAGTTALVYYSGHGGHVAETDPPESFLLPVDAVADNAETLRRTAISSDGLMGALRQLAADRVTVILDCCHAGGIGEPKNAQAVRLQPGVSDQLLEQLKTGTGRAIIAATRASEPAFVRAGERNGVFTHHLLAGLRGEAATSPGVVRIFDLFDYVQKKVRADQPGQYPVFKAELEENYPIAACPAPPVVPPPPASDGYQYDVFVSYADGERPFVERLVARLEGAGLVVCVDWRDFAAGVPRVAEMERAVVDSRAVAAILSPEYLASGFAEFETLTTQHLGLEERAWRLIPILRLPCPPPHPVPLRIRSLVVLDMSQDGQLEASVGKLLTRLHRPRL